MRRWGKICLPVGNLLRSWLSETQGKVPSRSAQYFEAETNGGKPVFGEALAFFEVLETKQLLAVYHPVSNCQQVLKKWRYLVRQNRSVASFCHTQSSGNMVLWIKGLHFEETSRAKFTEWRRIWEGGWRYWRGNGRLKFCTTICEMVWWWFFSNLNSRVWKPCVFCTAEYMPYIFPVMFRS